MRLTKEPLTDPFFTDETARQGARYRYTVRAVDRAGNRSAPSPRGDRGAVLAILDFGFSISD